MKSWLRTVALLMVLMMTVGSGAWATGESTVKYQVVTGPYVKQITAKQQVEVLRGLGFYPVRTFSGGKYTVIAGTYSTLSKANQALYKIRSHQIHAELRKISVDPAPASVMDGTAAGATQGQSPSVGNQGIKNILFDSDVTLDGIYGTHVQFFEVNNHWKVKGDNYFEIHYRQSIPNKIDNSTLSVFLNGTPVHTERIRPETNQTQVVRIPLEASRIQKGFNEIKVRTYHRISDDTCDDGINPGNWVLIHKESYIHLEYEKVQEGLQISSYPYPYLMQEEDSPVNGSIVVSDTAGANEIQSALLISADFGKRSAFKNIHIPMVRDTDLKDKKANLIYVGKLSSAPKWAVGLLSAEEKVKANDQALLKQGLNPFDSSKRVLVILSEKDSALYDGCKSLSENALVRQMNSDHAVVGKYPEKEASKDAVSDYLIFKDLGYSPTLLEGARYGTARYVIPVPSAWTLKQGAKLYLKVRYSETLNFDTSSLSVLINDVPVGSRKFSKDNANNEAYYIDIPTELLSARTLDIKVRFTLASRRDCKDISFDPNLWGFVGNESYLYLPHENRSDYTFEDYTAPFTKDGVFQDTTVMIGPKPTSAQLSQISDLVGFMGHRLKNAPDLHVILGNQVPDSEKARNLIVFGTPGDNPVIKGLNGSLNLPFDSAFTSLKANPKIQMLESYRTHISTAQLIPSPYNKEKTILVVSATEPEGLAWVVRYLSDFQFASQLKGDGAVIDSQGLSQWAYFIKQPSDSPEVTVNNEKQVNQKSTRNLTPQQINTFLITAGILFFVILVGTIVLSRYRKIVIKK